MKKTIIFFIIFFSLLFVLFVSTGFSQNPEWINYTNGDEIFAIAEEGGDMWVGSSGGVVKIDKLSGNPTFYNRGNSDFPDNGIRSILCGCAIF